MQHANAFSDQPGTVPSHADIANALNVAAQQFKSGQLQPQQFIAIVRHLAMKLSNNVNLSPMGLHHG